MPSLAQQFNREQIVIALEYIIKNKPILNPSTQHNLIYKGIEFPPKEVVRWAAKLAKTPNWESMSLSGGDNTNLPLKELGFKIIKKTELVFQLKIIEDYKQIVKSGNQAEVYKWELIEKYAGRPNLEAEDFGKEIIEIDYKNLIYHNGIAVRNHIARERPEEYRKAFIALFDESIDLSERLVAFQKDIGVIYKSMGETLHHHHDERSISTFLSFYYPDKYILYKNSFYTKYCKLLGIKQVKRNERYIHYLSLAKKFIETYIVADDELLEIKNNFLTPDCYPDTNNLIFAQDIFYQSLDAGKEDVDGENLNETEPEIINTMINLPLNQILYGPPGTGKTYETINKALEIIDDDDVKKLDWKNRRSVKDMFDTKVKSGQIVFTTFHQSLSYEDFIEGIKPQAPIVEGGAISYELEPGIFKSICETAKAPTEMRTQSKEVFKNSSFFKMSIGGKLRPDIHDWCMENNVIGLGYGNDEDFTELNKIKDWNTYRDVFKEKYPELVNESKYHIQAVFSFQRMKIGDIVVITKGNNVIDAVGKIVGDYYFNNESPTEYSQFRKVEWLAKNINQPPTVFFNKNISQQTIYEFYQDDVKKEAFESFFEQEPTTQKNYVIIIDEINRGNVSSIFGELITCIEDSKRIGNEEELMVTLPYSKTSFGVPNNVYIIGTMNTADRSVEALDTALRRRFSFVEMLPDVDHVLIYDVEEIDLKSLLYKMNLRLEKLVSRDHTIGHSFFLNLKNKEELYHAFYNKIIPLLQEYFFGDYGKIGLVLGSKFIIEEKSDSKIFADFAYEDKDLLLERKVYRINEFKNDMNSFIDALKAM